MRTNILIILLICLSLFSLLAGDFEWAEITDEDWNIKEDVASNIHDAVMIFERIETQDDLLDREFYYSDYKRIRILSPQGRQWGDVSLPYVEDRREIKEIMGRTILSDGTIIELNESHIYEKDIIKSDRGTVKQKSFYLPSISSDCIIEYYVKYESKYPETMWIIQKDIFVKEAQLTWDFYKGEGLTSEQYKLNIDHVIPNYVWFNEKVPLKVEPLPNIKEPEQIVFTAKNIPAFKSEPMTLPDMVFKMNARMYYGGNVAAQAYWGDQSKDQEEGLTEFTKDDDKLKKIVRNFESIGSEKEKIKAAYQWIQNNIKNVNYEDDNDDFEDNKNVNDVIDRKYGTSSDINKTFLDMLLLMNINAKLAWVVDRDEGLLEPKAKYWQFDRNLVAVEHNKNQVSFYRPASRYLPYGYLNWYHEGIEAMIVGSFNNQFANTPFSSSLMNKVIHIAQVKLDNELNATGWMIESYTGHHARRLRNDLHETTDRNLVQILKKRARKLTPSCIADSFKVKNATDHYKPLKIKYRINVPQIGHHDKTTTVIQPFRFIQSHQYGFFSETRKYPIVFDYSKEYTESFAIDLPDKWAVSSLPADTAVANSAGTIFVTFKILNGGKSLSLQRLFKLKFPFFRASQYEDIKSLMESYTRFSNIPIILEEKS